MVDLRLQSFQANDLPAFDTRSDYSSNRISNSTSGTNSFSNALEKASAQGTRTDNQENDYGQQPAVEGNRTQEKDSQTMHAVPVQVNQRADRTEKKQPTAQNSAATTQNATRAPDATASAAAQQASAAQTAGSDKNPKSDVTVTVSLTGSGDDLTVSLQGLPADLLKALLSAMAQQAITPETVKQADDATLDSSGGESPPDDSAKLTVKVPVDPADPLKGVNEIASLIQALANTLQNKASNKVELQSGQAPTTDLKASDVLAHLLPKEAPVNGAPANQGQTTAFRNLVSESNTQAAQDTTTGSVDLNGLNLISNGPSGDLKLRQDTDLTESLLSKVKMTVSLPGVVEGANETAEKEAQLPSEGNGESNLSEQGAAMQANMQRQEPLAETSNTTSFSSIVADRIAAVTDQIGLREKPLDITLRLKTEGGESLTIGLKDQAGRMIVQIRSADESVVNFLESQKETIVRHLEAKQISSSISISPIEEDLSKRQGREQPKNTWGRRRQPSDPNIETSI